MGFAHHGEVSPFFVGKVKLAASPLLFQTGFFGELGGSDLTWMSIHDNCAGRRRSYAACVSICVYLVVRLAVHVLNATLAEAMTTVSGKGLSLRRRTVLLAFVLVIYACSGMHWGVSLASFLKLLRHPDEARGPTSAAIIAGVVAVGVNARSNL